MLAKLNRLTKKKEFDNIFNNGRGKFGRILGVKAITNNLSIDRYGVIVSTKVSKLAVVRNKVKRQIREVLKTEIDKNALSKDYVIIALPSIKAAEFEEIKKELNKVIKFLANIK